MKLEKFPFKSCKWWSTNAVLKSLFFTKATGAVLQMTLNWTGGWCVSFSHCNSQCYTFVPFVLEEFRFKKCVIGPFSAQRIVIVQLLLHAWFFGTFIFPFICALCFGGWGKDIQYTVHFVCFVLVKAILSHRDTEILNLAWPRTVSIPQTLLCIGNQ